VIIKGWRKFLSFLIETNYTHTCIADSLEQQQQIWHFWYCKHDKWLDNWNKQICGKECKRSHNLAMSHIVCRLCLIICIYGRRKWVGSREKHSSICRGYKPLFLWYYVSFNVCLKTTHTFVWFCMLSERVLKNIFFLHTHTLIAQACADTDKYTLAHSNW